MSHPTPAPCLQPACSTPRAASVIPPKGLALQPTSTGDQIGAFPSPHALAHEEDMLSQRKGACALPARTPRRGVPAQQKRHLVSAIWNPSGTGWTASGSVTLLGAEQATLRGSYTRAILLHPPHRVHAPPSSTAATAAHLRPLLTTSQSQGARTLSSRAAKRRETAPSVPALLGMGPVRPPPNVLPTAGCVGSPFTRIQLQGLCAFSAGAAERNKKTTPPWRGRTSRRHRRSRPTRRPTRRSTPPGARRTGPRASSRRGLGHGSAPPGPFLAPAVGSYPHF
ncbi:hypothetical protein T484DRAFT_1969249 [Baffinella frigidus]|nr:hypothetical protein T484DRAFT_1969249 [Cryptophyta sp. CCMP2293]